MEYPRGILLACWALIHQWCLAIGWVWALGWIILFTHPSNWCGVERSSNLEVTEWENHGKTYVGLLWMWSWYGICGRWRTLGKIFSRIKWQSTSMCFVHSWNIGLLAIWIALVLSAKRGVGYLRKTPNSLRRRWSQTISLEADDIALYLASIDDLETVDCFLHFWEIIVVPKNIRQLVVEHWVLGQPA